MKITDVQYSLMYSLAAWSNLGMSIVGGYLIDKVFGPRIASVVFCLFCVVVDFGSKVFVFIGPGPESVSSESGNVDWRVM